MRVRSPKDENFRKGIREVPLFQEVRQVLDELHLVPDGGKFVIATNDRSSQKNPRTVFEKIRGKTGVDPWPRLMQNLRSSRETELAREYPLQTVTAWLGNTLKVALENDLQVREEDFTKAAQILAATGKRCRIVCRLEMKNPLFRRPNLQNKGCSRLSECPH